MANFGKNIIRRFNGFTNTIDGLTYRVNVDEFEIAIGCTDNPKFKEADWNPVFLCCRSLDYETVLEILKAFGFDKPSEWMERRMS